MILEYFPSSVLFFVMYSLRWLNNLPLKFVDIIDICIYFLLLVVTPALLVNKPTDWWTDQHIWFSNRHKLVVLPTNYWLCNQFIGCCTARAYAVCIRTTSYNIHMFVKHEKCLQTVYII